jgi:hypothetical protein
VSAACVAFRSSRPRILVTRDFREVKIVCMRTQKEMTFRQDEVHGVKMLHLLPHVPASREKVYEENPERCRYRKSHRTPRRRHHCELMQRRLQPRQSLHRARSESG